jgi:hypothetical protein
MAGNNAFWGAPFWCLVTVSIGVFSKCLRTGQMLEERSAMAVHTSRTSPHCRAVF